MNLPARRPTAPLSAVALVVCVAVTLAATAARSAQEGEVVATLATGRVAIWVARDGILTAAVENPAEPGAKAPRIVPLGSHRLAILLGAVEWSDAAGADVARMDAELENVARTVVGDAPGRLSHGEAEDLEQLGLGLLEPLRKAAARIFDRIDLGPEEALLEVVLAGYVENYGPEVWHLRYRARQDPLRGDYWRTRVLRPQYNQLYPPERGQPRTLIEVRYPPEDPAPALADLFRAADPRVAALRNEAVERMLAGHAHRVPAEDALAVLRQAWDAVNDSEAERIVARVDEQRGFAWVVPPREPLERVEAESDREPGAPTLRRPPPPPPQ